MKWRHLVITTIWKGDLMGMNRLKGCSDELKQYYMPDFSKQQLLYIP